MTAITYITKTEFTDLTLEILAVIPYAPQWVSASELRKTFDLNANNLSYRIGNLKKMGKIITKRTSNIALYQRIKDE